MYLLKIPKIVTKRFASIEDVAQKLASVEGDIIEEENIKIIPALFNILGGKQDTVDELMTAHGLRDKLIAHRGKKEIKLEDAERNLIKKWIAPDGGTFSKDITMFPAFAPLVEAVQNMEKLKDD